MPTAAPLFCLLLAGCASLGGGRDPASTVTSWAIQLSKVESPGAADRLARAEADLLVIDRPNTNVHARDFPTYAVVDQVHATRGTARERKLCLAYLNVGQDESYRTWHEEAGPLAVADDPEGWEGNRLVAYWVPRWREIMGEEVEAMVREGFDGMMLDWVEAWSEEPVARAAEAAGVDPRRSMTELVRALSERGRALSPGFLVLVNGSPLLLAEPSLDIDVDGVVQEDVSFRGRAVGDWENPESGDIPSAETGAHLARLTELRARGLLVLTLDYAADPGHRALAEERARERGFIPFVSRTPLDRLPSHCLRAR